jgi:hypothetical protein
MSRGTLGPIFDFVVLARVTAKKVFHLIVKNYDALLDHPKMNMSFSNQCSAKARAKGSRRAYKNENSNKEK